MEDTEDGMCHWKRTWKVVMPVVILCVVGYGIFIPVFTPYIVQSFTACDTDNDDCVANRSKAQTMKTYSDVARAIVSLVFSPVVGEVSDRIGRKVRCRAFHLVHCFGALFLTSLSISLQPVIIATVIAASVLPYLALVLFRKTTVPFLVVSSLSGVFSGSNIQVNALFPYIADLYPPEERSFVNGLVYMAAGVSLALSPLLSMLGNLGGYHPHRCFWISFGLGVVNLLYCVFVLPESLPRLAPDQLAESDEETEEAEEEEAEEEEEGRERGAHQALPQPLLRRARSNLECGAVGVAGRSAGIGGLCASIRAGWRDSRALLKSSRVFYMLSIINFLISLPESGLVEVALLYFNDMLDVKKESATKDNSTLLVVVGITVVFSSLSIKFLVARFVEVREQAEEEGGREGAVTASRLCSTCRLFSPRFLQNCASCCFISIVSRAGRAGKGAILGHRNVHSSPGGLGAARVDTASLAGLRDGVLCRARLHLLPHPHLFVPGVTGRELTGRGHGCGVRRQGSDQHSGSAIFWADVRELARGQPLLWGQLPAVSIPHRRGAFRVRAVRHSLAATTVAGEGRA